MTPPARRASPASRASRRIAPALRRPSREAELDGPAHASRRTAPPSWSVAISSGGCPPSRAAACSAPVSSRSCPGPVMFPPNRITPPISPRAGPPQDRRRRPRALDRDDEPLPDELAAGSAALRQARRRRGGFLRSRAPRRPPRLRRRAHERMGSGTTTSSGLRRLSRGKDGTPMRFRSGAKLDPSQVTDARGRSMGGPVLAGGGGIGAVALLIFVLYTVLSGGSGDLGSARQPRRPVRVDGAAVHARPGLPHGSGREQAPGLPHRRPT